VSDVSTPIAAYDTCVLDASVLIAFLKGERGRGPTAASVLNRAERGDLRIFLPTLAAAEVTKPGGMGGPDKLTHWLHHPMFEYVEVDRALADRSRVLVQTTGVKNGIDAAYLAVAQRMNAEVLFTYNTNHLPTGEYDGVRVSEPYHYGQQNFELV
jgi:predicted nucleic acid-binding protein